MCSCWALIVLRQWPFLQYTARKQYTTRLLEKSLIPHRVKCQTEAVKNLSRPLETWKMLKIILSKRTLIKISDSVIPHQTLCQHQFGFFMHLTWNVANVTFIFAAYPNTKPKEKKWGGHSILCSTSQKVRGTRPPCPPPNYAHVSVEYSFYSCTVIRQFDLLWTAFFLVGKFLLQEVI